jgi:hypothetical protein
VHLHLSHVPVPLVLLSFVYATSVAVALAHPGRPTLGAVVVLAGLTARWLARHRAHGPRTATVVVPAEPAVTPAAAG